MRALALTVAAVSIVAVASATAASSRDALIRPGVGIGEVRVGMTFAQVRQALGRPQVVLKQRRFGFGSRYAEYAWNGTDWIVAVVGSGDRARVVMVATGLRRERTRGAGVGSTDEALQRALGARCTPKAGKYDNTLGPEGIACYLGRSREQPHTAFLLTQDCRIPTPHPVQCPAEQSVYLVYEVRVGDPRFIYGYFG